MREPPPHPMHRAALRLHPVPMGAVFDKTSLMTIPGVVTAIERRIIHQQRRHIPGKRMHTV